MSTSSVTPKPTAENQRIDSLDVLRGFALLGILLLNILGFGLVSSGYFDPQVGTGTTELSRTVNLSVWAVVDLLFEGSMRGLFSLLFGAGVLLFLANGRATKWHFRRNFWLLVIGLFDAFVLLWVGDILVTYALASFLLFALRNVSTKRLVMASTALFVLLSLMFAVSNFGVQQLQRAHQVVVAAQSDANGTMQPIDEQTQELAAEWREIVADLRFDEAATAAELAQRRDSYWSVLRWSASANVEVLLFTIPVFLLWDALLMMLIGMALFRWRVLDASRGRNFYLKLTVAAFAVGLLTNGYEVWRAWHADFAILEQFAYFQSTYHLGRLCMALGYLGLVMLWCQSAVWSALRQRLAAVGRMALTNYLLHSAICLFIFTGAGFGLVGEWQRWQLYVLVVAIWLLQLWLSPRWLARYRFGPVEWLWRALTYGERPAMRRN